jgi:hypothetical protein
MDAPTLLALAGARLHAGGGTIQQVWVSRRALALTWTPTRGPGMGPGMAWVLLLTPIPQLWLLQERDAAFVALRAEANVSLGRRWGAELKGARLEGISGDPRERWISLDLRRRALTGRLEGLCLAFQAIPGRAGIRLDGLDLNEARLGLGVPFPADPPELPPQDPPPLVRWKARFGEAWESALTGSHPEVLPGEGSLLERHRAWSLAQATRLLLAPRQAAVDRTQARELQRLARYGRALAADRLRHESTLALRPLATRLSAELYRVQGAAGRVELLDGTILELPEGQTAGQAVQVWFSKVKRAERGLQRLAVLEEAQRTSLAHRPVAATLPPPLAPKEKRPMDKDPRPERRADGKGRAYRSLMIDGFETLIGKGDADNDALTFKVAAPLDFWLHVASVPGSHVIVRNPDRLGELPKAVLERAAELAAWYSKAREGGKVEVHLCRVADVSKPRGFAPGKVLLRQWKAIRVYPRE